MSLSRFHTREPFDDLQERVVPVATTAVLLQRCVEGVHEGGSGKGNMVAIRVIEYEPQILLLQVDHEAGTEVAREHLRRVVLHGPRGARTTRDHLPRTLEIDALRLRENEGLRYAEVVDGDSDLIRELARLARAVIADVHDRLSERLEEGHRALHSRFVATDHDREPGFDRADLAAGDRRVEGVKRRAARGRALRDLARC